MTRRIAPRRAAARGYTLIEVVVAFALLALALSLLLGAMTNATKQVKLSDEYGRAALHAQSLLDQAGVGEALVPGRKDGELEDGRYRWELTVSPYVDPTMTKKPEQILGAPQLMQLDLVLHWGEGGPRQTLAIRSLRLVMPTDLSAAGRVP